MTTVLLAEDDERIRRDVALYLRAHGFDVLEAADGNEAVSLLERGETPDVMVIDVMMPRLNGWEVRLKQLEGRCAHVPVIAISADASVETGRALRLLGIERFHAKPFAPEDLLLSIAGVVSSMARA